MARPEFVLEWAAEDTEEALRQRYRKEQDVHRRTWLQALWLLRQGRSPREVARLVAAGERSVARWVDWYRTGGLAGVLAHHQGGSGRTPLLTAAQQAQVADTVATGQFRTAAEIRAWIAQTFAIDLRPSTVYALLDRLRCAPKVPRPQHEKANAAMQEAWKKGGLRMP